MGLFDKLDKFLEKAEKFCDDVLAEPEPVYTKAELLSHFRSKFFSQFSGTLLETAKKVNRNVVKFDSNFNEIATANISEHSDGVYKIILKGRVYGKNEYGGVEGFLRFDATIYTDVHAKLCSDPSSTISVHKR